MKERLQNFMYGRYGQDNLNRFMSVMSMILLIISMFTGWTLLYSLALALLIYCVFRMFSKNTYKREQENRAYLKLQGKVTGRFSVLKTRFGQRKTHVFYKCPSCKTQLRVPKGKGRISITCPKCKTSFEKRT